MNIYKHVPHLLFQIEDGHKYSCDEDLYIEANCIVMANLRALIENTDYSLHYLTLFCEKIGSRIRTMIPNVEREICERERVRLMAFIELSVEICEDFTEANSIDYCNRVYSMLVNSISKLPKLTTTIAVLDLLARGKLKSICNAQGVISTGFIFESLLQGYKVDPSKQVHHEMFSYIRQLYTSEDDIIWALTRYFRINGRFDLLFELKKYRFDAEEDPVILLTIVDSFVRQNLRKLDQDTFVIDTTIYLNSKPLAHEDAFQLLLRVFGSLVVTKQFDFLRKLIQFLKTPCWIFYAGFLNFIQAVLEHEASSVTSEEVIELYSATLSSSDCDKYMNNIVTIGSEAVFYTMLAACINVDGDKVMKNSHFKHLLQYFETDYADLIILKLFRYFGSKNFDYMMFAVHSTFVNTAFYFDLLHHHIDNNCSSEDFSSVAEHYLELSKVGQLLVDDTVGIKQPDRIVDSYKKSCDYLILLLRVMNDLPTIPLKDSYNETFVLKLMSFLALAQNKSAKKIEKGTVTEYLVSCFLIILHNKKEEKLYYDSLVWRNLLRIAGKPESRNICLSPPDFLASNWPWEEHQHKSACSAEWLLKHLSPHINVAYLIFNYDIKCSRVLSERVSTNTHMLTGKQDQFLKEYAEYYQVLIEQLINEGMWMSAIRCCIHEKIYNKVSGVHGEWSRLVSQQTWVEVGCTISSFICLSAGAVD